MQHALCSTDGSAKPVKSRQVHEPALHRAALKPHPTSLLPSVATAATQRRVGEGGAMPGGALLNTRQLVSQDSAQMQLKQVQSESSDLAQRGVEPEPCPHKFSIARILRRMSPRWRECNPDPSDTWQFVPALLWRHNKPATDKPQQSHRAFTEGAAAAHRERALRDAHELLPTAPLPAVPAAQPTNLLSCT